jgi:hypothetical protein
MMNNLLRTGCFLPCTILLFSGCVSIPSTAANPPTPIPVTPAIVRHPAPVLSVDWRPFYEGGGCGPAADWKLYCSEDSALGAVGCEEVRQPSPFLGGLSPANPIALCLAPRNADRDTPAFLTYGCMLLMDGYYVIREEDGFRVIRTFGELQETFAPIDSPEEALSYALAATGYSASFDGYYGHVAPADYRYFTDRIEDTHVDTVAGGYEVNLFSRQDCGCGPKQTIEIILRLTVSGAVQQVSSETVYEDTSDTACVD